MSLIAIAAELGTEQQCLELIKRLRPNVARCPAPSATKVVLAIALMVNAKKGLSARQLKRDLKVAYKTAWYLRRRIRESMQQPGGVFGGSGRNG